jgi:hypothetical protein
MPNTGAAAYSRRSFKEPLPQARPELKSGTEPQIDASVRRRLLDWE